MAVFVGLIEPVASSRALVIQSIQADCDLSLVAEEKSVGPLYEAELAIINLDQVASRELERLRLLGIPSGGAFIATSRNPERLEAVRERAAALLLEPLAEQDLAEAMAAAKEVILMRRLEELSELVKAHLQGLHQTGARPAALLPPADTIEWIESDGNYLRIHSDSGCSTLRMTIAEAEERLRNTPVVRVHRGWMVNLERVLRIRTDTNGGTSVEIATGEAIAVSRSHRRAVREQLNAGLTPTVLAADQ